MQKHEPHLGRRLPGRTRVRLVIRPADVSDEMRRVEQVLAATGFVTAPGGAAVTLAPGSELRLAETAERYAVGGPLSEVVIAERDNR